MEPTSPLHLLEEKEAEHTLAIPTISMLGVYKKTKPWGSSPDTIHCPMALQSQRDFHKDMAGQEMGFIDFKHTSPAQDHKMSSPLVG